MGIGDDRPRVSARHRARNMQAVQLRGLKALPQTDGRVDADKVPGPGVARRRQDRTGWGKREEGKMRVL